MSFKVTILFTILFVLTLTSFAKAWEVDFSRRQKKTVGPSSEEKEPTIPPPALEESSETPRPLARNLSGLVQKSVKVVPVDRQEVVILSTAKGFIPAQLRLHKGVHYTVHVVNVNEEKKNVSFMLDAFNQHHATYFGQIRSFALDPDREGVYDFQCPETDTSGKVVVLGTGSMPPVQRAISSEE